MNKVINGRRYDTDKAREVAHADNMDDATSADYCRETLYRKRNGEHFLHCEGNARTPYATFTADGWAKPGEVLRPLTYEEAQQWASDSLSGDDYEAAFGTVPDDAGNVYMTLSIPAAAKAKLEAQVAKTGESQSGIVAKLIDCSL